jgi:hypothetical protein
MKPVDLAWLKVCTTLHELCVIYMTLIQSDLIVLLFYISISIFGYYTHFDTHFVYIIVNMAIGLEPTPTHWHYWIIICGQVCDIYKTDM